MTTSSPLVSVVVPVYNREQFLRQSISCICNQSYTALDIIIVDDGSSDDSRKILQEFAAKDSRITLLYQNHCYAGAARNLGLTKAKGKYILFLDSDDLFEVNMVEIMVKQAEKSAADCVFCRADMLLPNGRHKSMPQQLKKIYLENIDSNSFNISTDIAEGALLFCRGWAWDRLLRTDYVRQTGVQFPHFVYAEDAPFAFPVTVMSPVCSLVNEVLVHYRQNAYQVSSGSNISKNPATCLESCIEVYQNLKKLGAQPRVLDSCLCWMIDYIAWTFSIMKGEAVVQLAEELIYRIENRFSLSQKLKEWEHEYRFKEVLSDISKSIKIYKNAVIFGRIITSCSQKDYSCFVRHVVNTSCAPTKTTELLYIFSTHNPSVTVARTKRTLYKYSFKHFLGKTSHKDYVQIKNFLRQTISQLNSRYFNRH